jgi:GH24 family phage-related lysozyme (muramidase)
MTINRHAVTNAADLASQIIKRFEGLSARPENIGDNTITFGYGYTFIRKSGSTWSVYPRLSISPRAAILSQPFMA